MRRQSRVLRFCRVCHAPPGPVLAVRSQDFEVSAFGSALRHLYQAQAAHVQRARVTAATAPQGVGTDAGLIRFASLVCVSSPWLAPSRPRGQCGGQCRLRATA